MTSAWLLWASQRDKHDGAQSMALLCRAVFLEAAVVWYQVQVYFRFKFISSVYLLLLDIFEKVWVIRPVDPPQLEDVWI